MNWEQYQKGKIWAVIKTCLKYQSEDLLTKPLKLKKTKPIASRGKPTHLPRLEVAIPIPRSKNFKTIKNKTLKEKITEDSIVKIVRDFFWSD